MIDGVQIKKLRLLLDERGYLMEILRDDDELFRGFGQCYISTCFPGIVKAWHCHEHQWDHLCIISGNAKLGLYDDREDSPTRGEVMSLVIGQLNPVLVQVPPLVWHGYTPVGGQMAILLNVPTQHYNYDQPDEKRRPPFDPEIPMKWHTEGW
ncbi:MAG: dTDP-4-dehydrorhamnose 3,5-epimerase family protein [Armatimonadetes bacterium]|nr:dTDP-4-dehydrorhamnose 3,5-epimerase family protein [Armatimonadota bacterium]